MSKSQHPDHLDAVAAAGIAPLAPLDPRVSLAEVVRFLESLNAGRGGERLPKKARARRMFLALLCLQFERRVAYAEPELNDLLKQTLLSLGAQIDHVTCRRALVDYGLLKRDRSGRRYFLFPTALTQVLAEEVIDQAPALLPWYKS